MKNVLDVLKREIDETKEKLTEKKFKLTDLEKACLSFYWIQLKKIKEELE